jgi:threonine dehydrogenase-like Zn-dependent dehydrogenase
VRGLRWDGRELRLATDLPEPAPGPGEALVRVRLAGICRTDLEICRGYLGFRGTPGHEWIGEVIDAPARPALTGTRVVGEINFGCGACAACRGGLARHCATRRVQGIAGADGAFAELVAVPIRVLHAVPDALDDVTAVFVEPVAAAFEITEQLGDVAGRRTVVLGDGKLGLLVAQALAASGARVTLAGHHADKLAVAERLGIVTGVPDPGADLVIDATGSPGALAEALALVRPRGTIVLKTTVAAHHALDLAPAVINEITIVGSRCGSFPPALDALAGGRVRVAPLVAATYELSDGVAAFAHAAQPGSLKVLVRPGDG